MENMAYSELIKNFQAIRSYMRQFYVYGFKSRTEYDAKSPRSYDDVRRRIDSWLGEYMFFHQGESGKAQFLSVDSRTLSYNPLYQAFKTKTFTDNDIILHFFLLDLLDGRDLLSFREIVDRLYSDYLDSVEAELYFDESTIRNKLKEYVKLGLLEQKKDGRNYLYRRCSDTVEVKSWKDAVAFFSEAAPLGVIGSYLLDKNEFSQNQDCFRFKHHYILHALDSQVLFSVFDAMHIHANIGIKLRSRRQKSEIMRSVYPLRVYISTQTGRQYLLAYVYGTDRISFFRLDNISEVKLGQIDTEWKLYEERYEKLRDRIWGVSLGLRREVDHVEMTIHVDDDEQFIVKRLEREKRNGAVLKVDDYTYRYVVDTHDATEMLPWIRTFIGRIDDLHCSNPEVEKLFWEDLESMKKLYLGGEGNAVQ